MALVTYSDSEDESPPNPKVAQKTRKRKHSTAIVEGDLEDQKLPPLPLAFHSLYATNVRASAADDPALHGGRKRQTPHISGNWPTHVYLEWYPSHADLTVLEEALSAEKSKVSISGQQSEMNSLLRSDLGAQLPLHISLSTHLTLSTEQKDRFAEALEAAIEDAKVRPFKIGIYRLDWVSNFDKTRFFLVLRVRMPENDELNDLLTACNGTAASYGLPELYGKEDCGDCFHFSIAWSLEADMLKRMIQTAESVTHMVKELVVGCEVVKLKVGNTVKDISLGKESNYEGFG